MQVELNSWDPRKDKRNALHLPLLVDSKKLVTMTPLVLLVLVTMAMAQETTPDYTVTYNPGQDCLPYDGSVVPDCKKFVNPVTKEPYYHEHSFSKYLHVHIVHVRVV